jgi:hypothetical protein
MTPREVARKLADHGVARAMPCPTCRPEHPALPHPSTLRTPGGAELVPRIENPVLSAANSLIQGFFAGPGDLAG